jgi:hypothetical protein
MGSTPIIADRIINTKNVASRCAFRLFLKCASLYIEKMVLPYIILPGPIEIDESLVSTRHWSYLGYFPDKKWAFGMYCRVTKIPVIYYVKNRTHPTLVPLVKKHIELGNILLSDEFSSYVT